jgi:hypothetical protein
MGEALVSGEQAAQALGELSGPIALQRLEKEARLQLHGSDRYRQTTRTRQRAHQRDDRRQDLE